ncbi:23S rRNA (uracil(1939)-C(5))-methyltransferase RlmD [Candidatus Uhrbacteria bacterium]|nr:23S rRNA (uracil(1939)-C(5))-methyltransferase RlmD [Candidatus Uhrbacteria bacterium]
MSSPCPQKDVCGSCSWSHISYEKQLKQKLSDINGSFGLKKLPPWCQTILPSPVTEHYRNRMDFVIDFEGRVGMREKGKWWRVIDGNSCFLADTQIDDLFMQVRDWVKHSGLSYYDRKAHTGLLRYAVIRSTTLGQTMVNLVTSKPGDEHETQLSRSGQLRCAETLAPTTWIWSQNSTITDVSFGDKLETVTGPGYIEEEILGHRYRISPNAFFQTNPHGATLLLQTVEEFCGDLAGKTLLDLYCGSGFFSVALANRAARTIGVEMIPEAIADARVNATLNNVVVEFRDDKTEEFDWTALGANVVILDPPRSGMHDKALADILAHPPETIVYVSCNFKNFAREMVQLQKLFRVDAIRAIDMFPHTPHVELVTKLTRI